MKSQTEKRIALFTTFFEVESGYSLIAIAETQIGMLLRSGYEPIVLVQENFKFPPPPSPWTPEMVDIRPVIPAMDLTEGVAEDFDDRVARIQEALERELGDVNVCITHDIILQTFYKEHNVAMRRYARTRPDLLWLHWIHSCPDSARNMQPPHLCRYTPPPGYIVYPNDGDRGIVCNSYGLQAQEWRVKVSRSSHSVDPLSIWHYDPLTKALVEKASLLNGDVVAIYPARLDRGKQPEKIIRIMAGIKASGYEPRLLIVDWQSAGERFQNYIEELTSTAWKLGVSNNISFSSRLDDRCSQGVPRHVVLELMDFSNVYIHPSRVETYSLVVHEAALRGNLLVLNYDFPVMRELYGDGAIYMDFGSDRTDRKYSPDEQAFWNDEAKRLMGELGQNRAIKMKRKAMREWSPQAMAKKFIPLLYLQPVGE